jgi:cytochrome c556
LVVLIAAEAFAASAFKSTMKGWREHQKVTAEMISGAKPLDGAAMLADYIAGAEKLESGLTGSSTEAKDLRQRFAAFRAEAKAAEGAIGNEAAVKSHVHKLFTDCKSCHDLYNN